ncbi:hypothetical protein MHH_c00890 [Mannheimia haemolytica M42548]|nr:hypothetical protein MHH_c00890 [Mannheimia haemolytica M42548]
MILKKNLSILLRLRVNHSKKLNLRGKKSANGVKRTKRV